MRMLVDDWQGVIDVGRLPFENPTIGQVQRAIRDLDQFRFDNEAIV